MRHGGRSASSHRILAAAGVASHEHCLPRHCGGYLAVTSACTATLRPAGVMLSLGIGARVGFYIGPVSGLTFVERPGRPNSIRIMPTPNEVVFRGYRSVLCDAVDGHPRRDWELKTARAEYRFTVDIYARSSQPARDLGYRLYARRISSNGSSAACVHALMGPRPMFVWGWDPDHARVCYDCSTDHLHAVQKYDTATLCDGCGRHDSDTRVSWATDDEHLLIVASGLCPRCRAGD